MIKRYNQFIKENTISDLDSEIKNIFGEFLDEYGLNGWKFEVESERGGINVEIRDEMPTNTDLDNFDELKRSYKDRNEGIENRIKTELGGEIVTTIKDRMEDLGYQLEDTSYSDCDNPDVFEDDEDEDTIGGGDTIIIFKFEKIK